MTKREFLYGVVAAGPRAAAGPLRASPGRIASDGATLTWRHADGRLHASFSARAPGWVAVGFNAVRTLKGTRFVMAAPGRIEERLALVPDHAAVAAFGLLPSMRDAALARDGRLTELRFSLPHRFPDSPELRLDPGTPAHVMLAWSQESDFAHHSAWRRHFDVVL